MLHESMKGRFNAVIRLSTYALLVGLVAVVAYRRPLVTFDRVLYVAAVASLDTRDAGAIHDTALNAMGNESVFETSDPAAAEYVQRTMGERSALAEQSPLFRVKLGFVLTAWLLWKCGIPLMRALHLIS